MQPEVREQMFPLPGAGLYDYPPPLQEVAQTTGTAASVLETWIG